MEELFKTVCAKMSSIKQTQIKFMWVLLSTLMIFQEKSTYINLSRYSKISEKTYRRWYKREFDFMSMNAGLINRYPTENREWIAAIDTSFLEKSGKCTQGLGWFYCGKDNKIKKDLEISMLALVDLISNTAYALDVRQTLDHDLLNNEIRVDLYARQLKEATKELEKVKVLDLAADAFYAKKKMVESVISLGFHLVSKLKGEKGENP